MNKVHNRRTSVEGTAIGTHGESSKNKKIQKMKGETEQPTHRTLGTSGLTREKSGASMWQLIHRWHEDNSKEERKKD